MKNDTSDTELRFGNICVKMNRPPGKFLVEIDGVKLSGCRAALGFDGVEMPLTSWEVIEQDSCEIVFETKHGPGAWRLSFKKRLFPGNVEGLAIVLSGKARASARKMELLPLVVPRIESDHLVVNGRGSGGCRIVSFPAGTEKDFEAGFACVVTVKGKHMLFANPMTQAHASKFSGKIRPTAIEDLRASTVVEFAEKGVAYESEPVLLCAGADGHRLMVAWAESQKSPVQFKEQPAGWNSWDYYRWTITEDEVFANAEFIKSDPVLSRHIKYITIDDGWQYCYGEWDANPLFPSGMGKVAKKLLKMGFEPGIWMAPTVIEPQCRIAQWDTDMLAMGESGAPCLAYECMRRLGFVLDPTRASVQKWLYDLYARYRKMGYSYFKVDFIWQTLRARRFYRNDVPRARMMEMIMRPIRKAVGDAHILGCYYHDGPNIYADSMRMASDIHAKWESAKNSAVSIATRFAMHKRMWVNDPDFVVCRCPATSGDPDLNRLKPSIVYIKPEDKDSFGPSGNDRTEGLASMKYEEAKVLLALVVISGGAVNLSDKVNLLNKKGVDLLRRVVSAEKGQAGVPLDLFRSRYPGVWLQKRGKGCRVLLVNWKAEPRELVFNLRASGINSSRVKDFWSGKPVAVKSGRIVANVPAHGCLLADIE
ncbi:MAG: alpha-galactosidase [Kiritimatiellae bacterium]|nr:alpha-galactosidase [Kiritimatiellia bacterium]